jgi:16S rRNA (guanine527-N7)-methyltransferase
MMTDRDRALGLVSDSREIEPRIEPRIEPGIGAQLDRFVELLLQWQQKTNLIAPSTIPELWTRHVADSLQLLKLAPGAKRWVDFGSGGGFPGIPVACALTGKEGAIVHLVESNHKKAAFLREAVRVTGAPGKVHAERAEDFVDGFAEPVEIVTARALAPLENLLAKAYPLLKRGAQALFLKGQDVEVELTRASKCWTIEAELIRSVTDPGGRILRVRSLKPA